MSVLVWDGVTLAADCSANDGHVKFPVDKLWRFPPYIIGGVGGLHDIQAMRQWVLDGRKPEQFPKVTDISNFVLVTPARGLVRYTNKPLGILHGFNKCAFGTGRDFAYGALFMGASAVEAVKAAGNYDIHCGQAVVQFSIGEETND